MNSSEFVTLGAFHPRELIFNTEETKTILYFFFQGDHPLIDRLEVSDRIRSFAQKLLVKAVDASLSMGYVRLLYQAFSFRPGPGEMRRILGKLAAEAAIHWFEHAKVTDFSRMRVYDSVRGALAVGFRSRFLDIADHRIVSDYLAVCIHYRMTDRRTVIWS